jgi:putative membrane protein
MNQKSPLQQVFLYLKGMAMGAADVVPGVSGGTIAFISGIYEELVSTIHNLNLKFFTVWKKKGFLTAWKIYNLKFLLILFGGVFTSILSLAKLISWLLENHPILVWSFFFGLIIASILYVGKQIKPWNSKIVLALLLACFGSYFITLAEPISSPESNWFILFSGFIAIIAMILPGISGSFILVLLGVYEVIINTINNLTSSLAQNDWALFSDSVLKLFSFAVGAVIGLKLFSGILTWLFKNYRNTTLAVLTGFMIGALNKVWPWKEVLTWRLNSSGEKVPLLEKSILPQNFEGEPQLFSAIFCVLIGFLTIFLLEQIAVKKSGKNG